MKVRSWSQGNHLISAILIQPCGSCNNTVWLMTKRERLPAEENGDRELTECTYECLNCRTVMVVSYEHWIYPKMNQGKPLPENKASLEFYKQFTKEDANKALDMTAGMKLKCFVCETESGFTGRLNQEELKVAGVKDGQLIQKSVNVLVCDLCRERLVDEYIVQCVNTGCSETKWQNRLGFLQEHTMDLLSPTIRTAFENAHIVFGPTWMCDTCMAIKTGWKLN